MRTDQPITIRRLDYTPPAYTVDRIDLRFELDPQRTRVRATLAVRRLAGAAADAPLWLDGEQLELVSIAIDSQAVAAHRLHRDDTGLRIDAPPESFSLETVVLIQPASNTELSGLYLSNGNFFTQCEAQGFRRITFFPDRPDVMARYRVELIADGAQWPVLLSNGNLDATETLPDGRVCARWTDPFPKPSYLFAVVAGRLVAQEQAITTASGREALLQVWVEPGNLDRTDHAMQSLIRAIRWDEQRFGLELDLDRFMIVAVGDFNMGAMENKGLNIFNTKYVLARPDTATDVDFAGIEGVVGHEYFHNWSGNRVTCRDWFQLSLKEGFTVYRDQEFSADVGSRAVKRIEEVRRLRSLQFPEDGGPTAHPVRPDSYVEISNFYTVTIYEKGAEVVRLYETLLGRETFRKGTDLYFARHDGQAATCDDFMAAMAEVSGRDLTQFARWYAQAGTPTVTARGAWDAAAGTYTLTLTQAVPPTPGQPAKLPMVIPVTTALLGEGGQRLPLVVDGVARGTEAVLELVHAEQAFAFSGLSKKPVPSLLRGFSAPVKLTTDDDEASLLFRLAHDDDAFNRAEAGSELYLRHIEQGVAAGHAGRAPSPPAAALVEAVRTAMVGVQ